MNARLQAVSLCVCLAFVHAACYRDGARAPGATPTTAPRDPAAAAPPFAFDVPAGWTRDVPDRGKTVAMIRLNGTTWQDADGLIKVDVGRPVGPADQLAKSVAGRDGKVQAEPVTAGGVDGVKVETPSRDMSRPRFWIIVERGGQAYLIMAAQKGHADVLAPALDEVVASWRWTDDGR